MVEWTSIAGLTLGVANTAWMVWRHFRDRASLKLDLNVFDDRDGWIAPNPPGIYLRIANSGGKPITITAVGIGMPQDKGLMHKKAMQKLPKEILHGQYLFVPVAPLSEFTREVRTVDVFDALGRRWSVPPRRVKLVIEKANEAWKRMRERQP